MSAAPIVIAAALRKNPDGTLRTTNPFGDFNPAPATLTVDQARFAAALGSLLGFVTGTGTFSLDLRGAWMGGSEASTCTFGVRTVSGDAVGTHNWTVVGSVFSQTRISGSIGSGTLELFAVDSGGFEVTLGQYTWSVAAAAGGVDALAPTIPTHLLASGNTGTISCTMDASSDRYDNATPPSGLDHYDIYLDGVFKQSVSAVTGPAVQMTSTSIGSSSPAASTSQSAGTHTLTAAGIGIHNTAVEECLFKGAPLAGDGVIIAQVNAFTSAAEFSTSGLMLRETLDQGAIFAAVYIQPSAQAHGVQVKRRTATGGLGSNVNALNGITSGYLKLARAGNTVTASYSANGNDWSDIASIALPMANTAYWGLFLSSQNAGVSCTSTIREVNINQIAPVSFLITTAGTHIITARAVDVHGNPSAQCAGVSATAVSPVTPTQGKLRQHGGNYLYLDRNTSDSAKQARLQTWANADTENIGVQDIIFWSKLENPNQKGDYSGNWDASGNSGVKYISKMLSLCRSVRPSKPLRYMFQVSPYGFAGKNKSSTSFPTSFVPAYLGGAAYGPNNSGGSGTESTGLWGGVWINTTTQTTKTGASVGYFFRWWVPAVMTELINLMNYYGSQFDNSDPTQNLPNADCLEMASFLSESVTPLYTTYTDAAAMTQLARYFPGGRTAFPTVRLRYWGNFMQDNSLCHQVLDMMAPYFWDNGGPDCVNETAINTGDKFRAFPFDYAIRGLNPSGVPDPSYNVYVGKMGVIAEIEPDECGPRSSQPGLTDPNTADWTGPAALGNNNWKDYWAHANALHANYTTTYDNGYTGNNDKRLLNFLSNSSNWRVSTQPRHPDAQDQLSSLARGGITVNGATIGIGLTYKDVYPSGYPT